MDNYVLVTDWEKVDTDDFYLTEKWRKSVGDTKEKFAELKEMAKNGHLYTGYVVEAKNYCIYAQMDAHKVFIDTDMDKMLSCESAIIGNNHKKRIEYSY